MFQELFTSKGNANKIIVIVIVIVNYYYARIILVAIAVAVFLSSPLILDHTGKRNSLIQDRVARKPDNVIKT